VDTQRTPVFVGVVPIVYNSSVYVRVTAYVKARSAWRVHFGPDPKLERGCAVLQVCKFPIFQIMITF
jgi:hypothetical protein